MGIPIRIVVRDLRLVVAGVVVMGGTGEVHAVILWAGVVARAHARAAAARVGRSQERRAAEACLGRDGLVSHHRHGLRRLPLGLSLLLLLLLFERGGEDGGVRV